MTVAPTTLLNHELFTNDPLTATIPNLGVAKVVEPTTDEDWAVLRYELSSFVCDGAYREGLERILSTFLAQLDRGQQPATWVSGFYGSGKSHFTRVLEYLWRDVELPGGAKARGLVHLPDSIRELLVELTTAGKRHGGLWSAAGTLGAGARGSVRLALLNLIFRSARLPENYAEARLVLWLKNAGHYDAFEAALKARGREVRRELRNLYVSDHLAAALLEAIPGFAADAAAVRSLLKAQYPQRDDISDDEMLHTMEEVFGLFSTTSGKLPLVLLVFDELQQFIGDQADRTLAVQGVVEACTARFGGRVLFVATGQSALQATPQLAKLQGRFTVRVGLEDADVEKVVREVVLRKRADRVPDLQAVLDRASGEIDRHLAGSRLKPVPADKPFLVADYPLLPSRRRFWEVALRAVDSGGLVGQLRTQLRIVHETTRDVAKAPLGTVVPADALYDQVRADMLQSGILPRDLDKALNDLDDGTPDGKLARRLCATVFLIGKLEPTLGGSPDVVATADTLADLLVEDLVAGSASIRADTKRVLDELAARGLLMEVDGTYRLQTREGAEWEDAFNRRQAAIRGDESRLASERSQELRTAVSMALKGLAFAHGASKAKRTAALHFGLDAPPKGTDAVQVWVRDEWSTPLKTVQDEAVAAGTADPTVFVFLARLDAEALRAAIARHAAAKDTVEGEVEPKTQAGLDARAAMQSRQQHARARLDGLIGNVIAGGRVFLGGGTEVVDASFEAAVRKAVESAVARLYPEFGIGDSAGWGTVVQRATSGDPNPLAALGHSGDADKHPACKLVLAAVPHTGKRGTEIRKHFQGAPYGWPQEAVDGALLALLAAGAIRATKGGESVTPKQLGHGTIGGTDFYGEAITLSGSQKIELRKLLMDFGMTVTAEELGAAVPRMLVRLREQAQQAGGEPPFPALMEPPLLEALRGKAGNEQLAAVYDARDDLRRLVGEWKTAAATIATRRPEWDQLSRLLAHAKGLPEATAAEPQVEAIRTGRTALAEPNPLRPLISSLADGLRREVTAAQSELVAAYKAAVDTLEASDEWKRLDPAERDRLLRVHGLLAPASPSVGTVEGLLEALDAESLPQRLDRAATLPSRAQRAREEAAKLLEPKAVTVRPKGATLHTEAELDAYLADLRAQVLAHLAAGSPVII